MNTKNLNDAIEKAFKENFPLAIFALFVFMATVAVLFFQLLIFTKGYALLIPFVLGWYIIFKFLWDNRNA